MIRRLALVACLFALPLGAQAASYSYFGQGCRCTIWEGVPFTVTGLPRLEKSISITTVGDNATSLYSSGAVLLTGIYAISKRKEKIASEEKELAVTTAVEQAQAEAETKLTEALAQAEEEKKKAIESEVQKALEAAALPETEEEEKSETEEDS